jgi:hypothetical protein
VRLLLGADRITVQRINDPIVTGFLLGVAVRQNHEDIAAIHRCGRAPEIALTGLSKTHPG